MNDEDLDRLLAKLKAERDQQPIPPPPITEANVGPIARSLLASASKDRPELKRQSLWQSLMVNWGASQRLAIAAALVVTLGFVIFFGQQRKAGTPGSAGVDTGGEMIRGANPGAQVDSIAFVLVPARTAGPQTEIRTGRSRWSFQSRSFELDMDGLTLLFDFSAMPTNALVGASTNGAVIAVATFDRGGVPRLVTLQRPGGAPQSFDVKPVSQ